MRLLLVDGHYYAYRSFYAIRELANSRGEPTNALYGIAKALKRMVAELKPDFAAIIMDGGLPAHRLEQQPDYKANRAETPAALVLQFPLIEQLAPALGFTYLRVEDQEADDVLACYARAAQRAGIEAVLATNDKDLMQLVGDGISVYQPTPEGFQLLDPAAVEAKWGVPPERIGDILTLTGDAVDNIPGLPGVGPKTAAAWIKQFGSLDGLLANLSQVKSDRHRQMLTGAGEQLARNRIMVTLREDLPLPQPIAALPYRPDPAAQVDLFTLLEFKGLLAEAKAALAHQEPAPPVPQAKTPSVQWTQGELL